MRKLLAIAGAAVAFSSINAQSVDMVQVSTPTLGSAYSWSWNSNGRSVILSELPVHEALYSLPFGASFYAGHCGVIGQWYDPISQLEGPCYGYQLYIKKDVGLEGAYLKFDAHFLVSEQGSFFGLGAGLGYKF